MFDGAPLFPVEDLWQMFADGASGMGVELGEGVPVLCLEAVQDCLQDSIWVVGEGPSGVHTAWMVRRPVYSTTRLTYRRDLYGVLFLPYFSRSWAAAAMRWACHSWNWWRRVVRSVRRWAFWSRAPGVLGRSRVASSSFVVQMSWTSCWRVRSRGAPVWLVSRSMPHACAARRMVVVVLCASGRRKMACRALLYLCQAPWSSSAGNGSVGGMVSPGRVAVGGGRLGMMRSM